MATGDSVGDCELEHQHGKARVRVARVWHEGSSHVMVEWSVSVSLRSKTLAAYTEGDNSAIVATDTIKNTVSSLPSKLLWLLAPHDALHDTVPAQSADFVLSLKSFEIIESC